MIEGKPGVFQSQPACYGVLLIFIIYRVWREYKVAIERKPGVFLPQPAYRRTATRGIVKLANSMLLQCIDGVPSTWPGHWAGLCILALRTRDRVAPLTTGIVNFQMPKRDKNRGPSTTASPATHPAASINVNSKCIETSSLKHARRPGITVPPCRPPLTGQRDVGIVPLRAHDGLNAVGDEVAGLKGEGHAVGAHADAVADADGVEPAGIRYLRVSLSCIRLLQIE